MTIISKINSVVIINNQIKRLKIMEINNIIFSLIFIFLMILLVVYIFCNNNSDGNKDNNKDNNDEKVKKKEVSDLFQPCPCMEGYVCDNGICKLNEGQRCLTHSSCKSGSFCFNGICTSKPSNVDEVFSVTNKYNEFSKEKNLDNKTNNVELNSLNLKDLTNFCTERHPMKLLDDRFIIYPGWWSLHDLTSICQSFQYDNTYYALNEKGHIYKINCDDILIEHIGNNIDTSFVKLFNINDKIYSLTYEGEIYKLIDETKRNWTWEVIEDFYDIDTNNIDIKDIYTSKKGQVVMIRNSGTYINRINSIFSPGENRWIRICREVDKISLAEYNDQNYILTVNNNTGIIYKYNNNQNIEDNPIEKVLEFKALDAELDPKEINVFYTIDGNNEVHKHKLKNDNLINYKITGGLATNLIKTDDDIWITTKKQCISL